MFLWLWSERHEVAFCGCGRLAMKYTYIDVSSHNGNTAIMYRLAALLCPMTHIHFLAYVCALTTVSAACYVREWYPVLWVPWLLQTMHLLWQAGAVATQSRCTRPFPLSPTTHVALATIPGTGQYQYHGGRRLVFVWSTIFLHTRCCCICQLQWLKLCMTLVASMIQFHLIHGGRVRR